MTAPNVRRAWGTKRPPLASNRRGAALIEVMVAMSVLVLGLTGVAGMTVSAGRRASALTGTGGRTAVQIQVVDQLMVLPYTQLASKAGCTTVSTMPYPHTRDRKSVV